MTPQIRFPEFSTNWTTKKLNEITNRITSKNNENNTNVLTISAQFGLISQLDFFNKSVAAKDLSGYYILTKNDFAYNKSYSTGYPMGAIKRLKNYENGVVSTLYICFRNTQDFDESFAEHFFESGYHQNELEKVAQEGARNHGLLNISIGDFFNINLNIPTLPEQQKIASFLTAVDDRLQALKKKKMLLEQYKKGVMQQIFSQQLRFKDDDGSEFPDWVNHSGNELFENISDKNHNSDLPILAITQEHGAIPRELIDFSVSVTDKSLETYKVVQKGDFIISLRSFQGGIEYSDFKGICSPAYIVLRPVGEVNRNYFRHYLKTREYISRLTKNLEGIRDGKMISYKYFSEVQIPTPSLKEQTKIANFLSALDEKIKQTEMQIEKTEQYKKGLLQQMFC